MIPKCILCGNKMRLDDKEIDYKIVNTWWECDCCEVGLTISYNRLTGYRTINANIEQIGK